MAILNPRFAFLEDDFKNPNLNNARSNKIEHNTPKFQDTVQVKSEVSKSPLTPTTLYIKSIPIFVYANAVPADIYSASLFLLVKNF